MGHLPSSKSSLQSKELPAPSPEFQHLPFSLDASKAARDILHAPNSSSPDRCPVARANQVLGHLPFLLTSSSVSGLFPGTACAIGRALCYSMCCWDQDGQWHRGHPESPPTHPGLQPLGACKPGFPRWPTYRAPLPRARKGLTKPGPIHISALRCVTPLLPIPRGHLACPGAGPVAGVPWQVPWKLKRDQEGQQRLSNFGKSSGSPGDPEL